MSRSIDSAYTVRVATRADVEQIPEIERLAAQRFADSAFADAVLGDVTPMDELHAAQAEGRLWVAVHRDQGPVGFAFVELVDGHAHLDEIDVLPDHGRQGLGAALVAAVCDWAGAESLAAVTLTTYRDIPWNAPFYRRLGFEVLPPERWSARLAALVEHEAQSGLRREDRVVMRFAVERL